jgi:hypothetical protein
MHQGDFPGPMRRDATASAQDILLQDLDRHIRSAALKHLYQRWRASLLDQQYLPSIETFSFSEDGLAGHAFVATVEDACFRLVSVGSVLAERYGQNLAGTTIVDDAIEMTGSLKSYRACVEKETPVYEYIRYALSDDRPMLFERLILPLFDAGCRVTHVAGVVLLTELDPTH